MTNYFISMYSNDHCLLIKTLNLNFEIIIIQFIADTQSIYYITESYRQKDKWERLKKISN